VCVFACLASYKAYAVPTLINALKSITYHFYPMIFVLPQVTKVLPVFPLFITLLICLVSFIYARARVATIVPTL
jgi:hypothetical protein